MYCACVAAEAIYACIHAYLDTVCVRACVCVFVCVCVCASLCVDARIVLLTHIHTGRQPYRDTCIHQVMDGRTRHLLDRMIANGYLRSLHGTISTGKEACVYYGVGAVGLECLRSGPHGWGTGFDKSAAGFTSGPERASVQDCEGSDSSAEEEDLDWPAAERGMFWGESDVPDDQEGADGCADAGWQAVAVKIFKTSIMVFRDRDRYVSGDWRWKQGYSKSARKMVSMWAEKEFRNLHRMHTAGVCV